MQSVALAASFDRKSSSIVTMNNGSSKEMFKYRQEKLQ